MSPHVATRCVWWCITSPLHRLAWGASTCSSGTMTTAKLRTTSSANTQQVRPRPYFDSPLLRKCFYSNCWHWFVFSAEEPLGDSPPPNSTETSKRLLQCHYVRFIRGWSGPVNTVADFHYRYLPFFCVAVESKWPEPAQKHRLTNHTAGVTPKRKHGSRSTPLLSPLQLWIWFTSSFPPFPSSCSSSRWLESAASSCWPDGEGPEANNKHTSQFPWVCSGYVWDIKNSDLWFTLTNVLMGSEQMAPNLLQEFLYVVKKKEMLPFFNFTRLLKSLLVLKTYFTMC